MYRPSKKIIKELRHIAKENGTKLSVTKHWRKHSAATYDLRTNKINIHTDWICDRSDFINSFFHELGHHYCVTNKLWVSYHHPKKRAKYTWLKAERWVDEWAAKQVAERYPKIKYDYPYSVKETVEGYRSRLKKNGVLG